MEPNALLILIPLAFALFFVPALWIAQGLRFTWVDRIGLVLLCFASGVVLNSLAFFCFDISNTNASNALSTQTTITEISIALALPLLLFSVNLKQALAEAGLATKSMIFALFSVVTMSSALATFFEGEIANLWQIAGLAVSAYTGGGPNMAAVNAAIDGDHATFVTMTSYDIMLSALFLLFILSFGRTVFSGLLKPHRTKEANTPFINSNKKTEQDNNALEKTAADDAFTHMSNDTSQSYLQLTQSNALPSAVKAFFLACITVGLSALLSRFLPESTQSTGIIILITTLGVAASFVPAIQSLKVSFKLGMYLVLVFCFTMGSMTNISVLADLDWALFAYIGLMLTGALVMHALLCKAFNIDVDTFLVTISAAVMSVPFIPVIVASLRNPALLVPGFAAAIFGYAIGNYLGIAVALTMKAWL